MDTKSASCPHHWMPVMEQLPDGQVLRGKVSLAQPLSFLVACPLCFRYATAEFECLGFHLDAKMGRAMRARKVKR